MSLPKLKKPKAEPPKPSDPSFSASVRISVGTFVADMNRPGDVGKSEVSQITITRTIGANPASFVVGPGELEPLRILIEQIEKETLPALMEYGKVDPDADS